MSYSAPVRPPPVPEPTKPSPKMDALTPEMRDFFFERGISNATLERNRIFSERTYSPAKKQYVDAIAFPYYKHGAIANIKYRDLPKTFWQVKGAEKILYGYDDAVDQSQIIIVEVTTNALTHAHVYAK